MVLGTTLHSSVVPGQARPSISTGQGWETERSYTLVITEQCGSVFKGRSDASALAVPDYP